jgi:hypothetical protein
MFLLNVQKRQHPSHDIGLGDGLIVPNGQGVIPVGLGPKVRLNEKVPRHRQKGLVDPGV